MLINNVMLFSKSCIQDYRNSFLPCFNESKRLSTEPSITKALGKQESSIAVPISDCLLCMLYEEQNTNCTELLQRVPPQLFINF